MNLHVLDAYRPGYGLPSEFYTSEAVFAAEQERIFRNNWYFAGHSIELPEAGSYLTLTVGGAPVVVVRDRDGKVHGHHNVCRHRGSIVCLKEHGKSTRLVCPYHSWTYAHDGRLIGAPMVGEDFDKKAYGLKPVAVGEFDGLIFVNLSDRPSPFEDLRDHLSPILKPQGMARAKMALVRDYHLDVNWKVIVENNRECYHCEANHGGYVSVQYDTENDNPDLADEIAERLAECSVRWGRAGLDVSRVNTSSSNTAEWFRANRTPVRKGMVTESPDGQQLCPVLMGDFRDPDMGTARANTNINFWCHANADYAHTVRITPVSPTKTVVRGYWLVAADAAEGRDYDPEQIAAFHHTVMSEDWEICRRQWIGVTSPAFEPGPFAPVKEASVDRYVQWYVRQMRAG